MKRWQLALDRVDSAERAVPRDHRDRVSRLSHRSAGPARRRANARPSSRHCAQRSTAKPPAPCAVHRVPGPVAVTVWLEGRVVTRAEGYGSDVGTAVDAAAKTLAGAMHDAAMSARGADPGRRDRRPQRRSAMRIGSASTRCRLSSAMMALNPGIEGIGAESDGKRALLLPHELVAREGARRRSDRANALPTSRWASISSGSRDADRHARRAARRSRAPTLYPLPHRYVRRAAADHARAPVQLYARHPAAAEAVGAGAARGRARGRSLPRRASRAERPLHLRARSRRRAQQTDPMRSARTRCRATPARRTSSPSCTGSRRRSGCASRSSARSRTSPICSRPASAARTLPDGTAIDCVLDQARDGRAARLDGARRSSRSPSTSARPATRATCRSRRSSRRSSCTCSAPTARSAISTTRRRSSPTTRPSSSTTRARRRSRSRACTSITGDPRYAQGRREGARLARRLVRLLHGRLLLRRGALDVHRRRGDLAGRARTPKYREFCDGYGAFLRAAAAARRRPPR